ncbi:RNA polymerase-binding transcription factor DksA [Sphaerisporangium siamense]|uniref:DnaK suppressor protein n=1 Tax=Sphaerisporangium siamense TaxID=795645 RepID=A0A7W7D7F0_9ACTN|nr:TraR/DksA C4-type zinc finger protein [Sphaerisporangium siamense]MBB4701607.1 DnaK suppressor protein [Sphaerisporangium siamense]GII85732.1 RNA polymerase-binding transcription factor DksA [Sphaerisporangium siamense]
MTDICRYSSHLSSVQLQALRQDLEEQLERRSRQLLGLRAEARTGNGADDTWRELLVSLTAADRAIAELTQALDRMTAGTYGRCTHCETVIPFERLKIRPLARCCIDCQRRYEAA